MAGFTNRWVHKVEETLPLGLDLIREKDNYFWEEEGREHTLRRLIKLDPEIRTENSEEFISGRFFFNWEQPIEDYEIKEDGTIEEMHQIIRRTNTISFWISINQRLILFPNSKSYTKEGIKTLSRLFFNTDDGFVPVGFDIQAIESAWRDGSFTMWTYSFKDRQGSINKGTHYGEDIDPNDPMYQQTVMVPKNFVGIKMVLFNLEIKVRVTRDGTVTFYRLFDEPQQQPELFRAIGGLLDFQV